MDGASPVVNQQSSAESKIHLFRSLFRGRDDVYPRRFESRKTGKSGYAPACSNEWVRGICEKPRIKCAVCQHRRFLPVTDDVIRWGHSVFLDERFVKWADQWSYLARIRKVGRLQVEHLVQEAERRGHGQEAAPGAQRAAGGHSSGRGQSHPGNGQVRGRGI